MKFSSGCGRAIYSLGGNSSTSCRGASGHPHEKGPAQVRLERAARAANASAAIWRRPHDEESSGFFRVVCITSVVHTCGTSPTEFHGDADVDSDRHANAAHADERCNDFGGA